MIPVTIIETKSDGYDGWPTKLPALPNVGELVYNAPNSDEDRVAAEVVSRHFCSDRIILVLGNYTKRM